ncbi:MAG: cytidine deaminase [Synergistaceae bacterium]|nr:cytidine deaminase [Synergistaceae bacterium]
MTETKIAAPLEWEVPPEELLKRAREAAVLSYAPYSRFHVGSALLFRGGEILTGCNVENASYGLTLCAERGSISGMVSKGMRNPLAIAVAGSYEDRDDYLSIPCPPCGACRQTLMEFNPDMRVVLASPEGPRIFELKELLPCSFDLNR